MALPGSVSMSLPGSVCPPFSFASAGKRAPGAGSAVCRPRVCGSSTHERAATSQRRRHPPARPNSKTHRPLLFPTQQRAAPHQECALHLTAALSLPLAVRARQGGCRERNKLAVAARHSSTESRYFLVRCARSCSCRHAICSKSGCAEADGSQHAIDARGNRPTALHFATAPLHCTWQRALCTSPSRTAASNAPHGRQGVSLPSRCMCSRALEPCGGLCR